MKKKEQNQPIPSNYKPLPGSERTLRPGAKRVAAANPAEKINITICVRRRPDGPPLPDHDYWMKTPPGRRKYISREEFVANHGATQEDLDSVTAFAQSHGLEIVEADRARRTVIVRGTVSQINTAFAVDLGHYETATEKYRGREGFVHLPHDIADMVEGVFGLDNRRMARRAMGFSAAGSLTPVQVAQYYNFPTNSAAGQTIGVLEFSDPVAGTAGYDPADITTYFTTGHGIGPGFTTPHLQDVLINGASNSPGSGADIEVLLDIDVAGAVAQGANIAVYFTTWDENGWILAVKAAAHPMGSQPSPSVVSISWDWAEFNSFGNLSWSQMGMDQLSATFQDAAAFGVTFFVASGDYGSDCEVGDGKAHVFYPASDPWVTGCGGTEIGTDNGSYAEVTWAGNTGGGVSYGFPVPLWQAGTAIPASANGDGHHGRGVPDIGGYANGYSIVQGGSSIGPFPGTSETAPLYAGLIATVNASLNDRVGFLNPTIYAMATQPGGTGVFRDINDGASNSAAGAPGYTAGPGWDACTGWGVMDGSGLLSFMQGLFQKSMTFIMDRTTFGQDEVNATGGVFDQAFFIVVDGFKPVDFPFGGISALSSSATPATQTQLNHWAPVIPHPVGSSGTTNITLTPVAVSSDDPSLSPEVQRFTFTYKVTFPDQTVFTGSPASDFPEVLTLNASLAVGGQTLNASAQIELIEAADPFFSSESNGGISWLSEDLRVFYAKEGSTLFGAPALGNTPAAARNFIQWIISHMSGPNGTVPGSSDSFEHTLKTDENASAISLLPTTLPFPFQPIKNIYNFAIARVRLNGTSAMEEAMNVRAFFRLFQAQSTYTAYQSPGTSAGVSSATGPYRQWSDGVTDGQKAPLLGISGDGSEYVTVPCFAAQRVTNTSVMTNMTTQHDGPNVKNITPDPGNTVYTYFGCWLDTNQSEQLFPFQPGANPDGPFTGQTLNTLGQVISRGGHQCLVVEIVDDGAPIINNATPATSDKIAQRNIAFTIVANPGVVNSRLATHTFDIRPSLTALNAEQLPDELMIDWRNVPDGSVASIYLPAASAEEILAMAAEMYVTHSLSTADPHTIQCRTGGTTYIPIPKGSGQNFAGLFSVELPFGITKGQEFKIVVRQITGSTSKKRSGKRHVYGAFQISIPVSVKADMLIPEERMLSVMRWIQETIPASSRWYPVFIRYIEHLAGRVDGLGGVSASIPPTQTGIWPGLLKQINWKDDGHHEGKDDDRLEFTGKVDGILYDHFGDFTGFIIETRHGEKRKFLSHERKVHNLTEVAWLQRNMVTIFVHHEHPERPLEILVHGEPPAEI